MCIIQCYLGRCCFCALYQTWHACPDASCVAGIGGAGDWKEEDYACCDQRRNGHCGHYGCSLMCNQYISRMFVKQSANQVSMYKEPAPVCPLDDNPAQPDANSLAYTHLRMIADQRQTIRHLMLHFVTGLCMLLCSAQQGRCFTLPICTGRQAV